MLVVSRKLMERIQIGDKVVVTTCAVKGARLFHAPEAADTFLRELSDKNGRRYDQANYRQGIWFHRKWNEPRHVLPQLFGARCEF